MRRSTRARSMRIAVYPDARVVVTVPERFSPKILEHFLHEHSGWIEKTIAKNRRKNVIRFDGREIPSLKIFAAEVAASRCKYFATIYGVEFQKISIRAQKSRWGSCSKRRHLSFNFKIAVLPKQLRDYIIVHEICHLKEMNHSRKFWDLVARTVPNHASIRKELRATVVLKNIRAA